jgi:hypothetical protein
LLEHLVDAMVDLYVRLLYKIIYFISNCLSRIKISNYYIYRNIYQQQSITGTTADTSLSKTVLEPLLITPNYQQRVISSGSKTATHGSYGPLQMMFSIVVFPATLSMSVCSYARLSLPIFRVSPRYLHGRALTFASNLPMIPLVSASSQRIGKTSDLQSLCVGLLPIQRILAGCLGFS